MSSAVPRCPPLSPILVCFATLATLLLCRFFCLCSCCLCGLSSLFYCCGLPPLPTRASKERYGDGALPERMTLQTDNGGEFGREFQDALPDNIQFVQIPANTPNQAGAIEGANKVWRGALRRLLRSKGEPLKKWSQYAGEATEIVNTRPNATLTIDKKWRSPMVVFRASRPCTQSSGLSNQITTTQSLAAGQVLSTNQ